MAQDMDERLANLLLGDAPAERDPMFRLGVLARRERQRFRRRSAWLFAAALGCVVFFLTVAATHAASLQAAAALMVSCVLAVSYSLYAPAVAQIVRSLRSSR